MHHRTLHRALLLGALAAGAWTATELADDHAAHADAKPAVTIDRPAVLDRAAKLPHRLPQQASARAKAAVAKVTAEPTPEPTEDQADEAEPSTPAEPDPEPTPPVEAPPADEPPVELPPVEVPLPKPTPTEPLPTPVELPPVEVPPLPAPPVEVPTPATPTPLPTPPADPAVVVPGAPPAAADPIPAPPPAGTVVTQLIAELTAGTDQPACDDSLDARRIDRDALRHLLAGLDHEPPPTTAQKPAPGCPGTPDRDTPGGVQVKPPPPSAAEMVVAYLARSHVPPVLGRLEHARARSHLPAGRSPHIEPGPA